MAEADSPLPPGALPPRLQATTEHALARGALKPIPAERTQVPDAGVDFEVRITPSLADKIQEAHQQQAREAAGESVDPFADPDPDLVVGDLSATHFAILNKFPVLEHHLLLVTRAYEAQRAPLSRDDFAALQRALAELGGLGFYNAGAEAGASQGHKHLQVVPGPLHLPMEARLHPANLTAHAAPAPDLPFPNAACRTPGAETGAGGLFDAYRAMRDLLGLTAPDAAYNLLVTREWMLLVPRSTERFEGLMTNGLGFAGDFLVRDESDLAALRRVGPMRVLRGVTGAIGEGED